MQLTSVAPPPHHDRVATQREFNDLALELTRSDAQLTDAVRNRNRIGAGWDTWFEGTAKRVLAARDAYMALNPLDQQMHAALGADALDLASSGGQLGAAYRDGDTFGAGWESTLDRKIDNVRTAADRLLDMTRPPSGPDTPGGVIPGPVGDAIAGAIDLVGRSLDTIRSLPAHDRGSDATKDARIAAYRLNMEAQGKLEAHFNVSDDALVSVLRAADGHLEDANWQLAKKPSPDGRFNGVDIPGAIRDTEAALERLTQLGDA